MTHLPSNDESIRVAIDDVRSADEREAPAFDTVLKRSSQPPTIDHWRVFQLAAAGLLFLTTLGVANRLLSHRARIVVPGEVQALSTWQPMTDVLLATPNAGVLTETPHLEGSLLPIPSTLFEDGQ